MYFQKSQYESVAEPEKRIRNLCSLTHPVRTVLLIGIFEDVKKNKIISEQRVFFSL